ncbi:unnamed protein product [Cuscuta epithymum]|uniref:KHDC4/BBP-like KH-domain type I domain-containing protein n=1 Tax=Cuscuta epithymum TaxID=186058 RepID=A0AAV0CW44_9ASTE|nr:unnamed protein product [Cuscuta epithymum]
MEEASRNIQSTTATPSTAKISILKNKSGFLIPKNKLAGSLVPVFRAGNKDASQSVNEDVTKLVRRKTKWGTDLTQDATVRKGRALAYQTRVDQITQQLSSQSADWDENHDVLSTSTIEDSTLDVEMRNLEVLELEKREAIGEIIKLNPNYKPPAGYKPVLKEAKIPIPIKEHPGYNFIGLIFGSMCDTHKRLEKETGAKVKVYGIKEDTGQKVEVMPANENETCSTYKEMYVQVLADTYEKADTAVSLVELLVTPVSMKTGSESKTISSNDGNIAADNSGGVVQQPIIEGSDVALSHGHFQQGPWFPGIPSQSTLPGSIPSTEPLANPSNTPPSLLSPQAMVARFGSVPQSHPLAFMARSNMPHLLSQQPLPPINPLSAPNSAALHRSQVFRPGTVPSQLQPFANAWNSLVVQGGNNAMPTISPLAPPQQGGSSHAMASIGPSPPLGYLHGSMPGSAISQQPANPLLQSQSISPNNSVKGRALNFDAIHPNSMGAPRPHQQSGSSDFIFQPHRPNQVFPRPADSQSDPPTNFIRPPQLLNHPGHPPPQPPSVFRPEIRNSNPLHVMQGFPEINRMVQRQPTPVGFSAGPTGPSPPAIRPMAFPNSGSQPPVSFSQMQHQRNFSPLANPGSPFPPRTGSMMFQQNSNPGMVAHLPHEFRPGNPASGTPGMQQRYDPFSPTSLS